MENLKIGNQNPEKGTHKIWVGFTSRQDGFSQQDGFSYNYCKQLKDPFQDHLNLSKTIFKLCCCKIQKQDALHCPMQSNSPPSSIHPNWAAHIFILEFSKDGLADLDDKFADGAFAKQTVILQEGVGLSNGQVSQNYIRKEWMTRA